MTSTKIAGRVVALLGNPIQEKPVAKTLQENPRRKKRGRGRPSAAQLRAREKFARMARSGAFRKSKRGRRRKRAEEAELQENKGRRYEDNRRRHGRRREDEEDEQEQDMALQENRKGRRAKKSKGRRKKRGGRRMGAFAAAAASQARSGRKRKKRRAKARRSKGRRGGRGRRRGARTVKTHVVRLPPSKGAQVQVIEVARKRRGKKRRGGGKKRRKGGSMMLMENPVGVFSGPGPVTLYENQGGAFTMASIRSYGITALGVAVGFIVADVTDRIVATRTPKDGKNPWYGKDAAAAIRTRPDGWRLAAQGGGAVLGMAGAYALRGRGLISFLVGGVAIGFGANLGKMLWDWYGAPAIFKVEQADASKPSTGNRLYSMEQSYIQDQVTKMFETRPFIPQLAPGQQDPPVVQSPMGAGGGSLYQLGQPGSVGRPGQQARAVVRTGRLGTCGECGCSDGCYSNCPTLCPNCPEFNNNTMCRYQVQAGDDIASFAAAGGVTVEQINQLNNDPTGSYWQPGAMVMLPYGTCSAMEKGSFTPVQPSSPLPQPLPSPQTDIIQETFQPTPPMSVPPGNGAGSMVAGIAGLNPDEHLKRSLEFSGAMRSG